MRVLLGTGAVRHQHPMCCHVHGMLNSTIAFVRQCTASDPPHPPNHLMKGMEPAMTLVPPMPTHS